MINVIIMENQIGSVTMNYLNAGSSSVSKGKNIFRKGSQTKQGVDEDLLEIEL